MKDKSMLIGAVVIIFFWISLFTYLEFQNPFQDENKDLERASTSAYLNFIIYPEITVSFIFYLFYSIYTIKKNTLLTDLKKHF